MNLVLPWPPAVLSPNGRAHWRVVAKAKKRFRAACALTSMSQGARAMHVEKIALRIVFVPPCRRHRDVDNCVAAMKAGFDGLADVLKVDDSKWTWSDPPRIAEGELGGFVRVELMQC